MYWGKRDRYNRMHPDQEQHVQGPPPPQVHEHQSEIRAMERDEVRPWVPGALGALVALGLLFGRSNTFRRRHGARVVPHYKSQIVTSFLTSKVSSIKFPDRGLSYQDSKRV